MKFTLKDFDKMYKNECYGLFITSYQPILRHIGEIIIQVDDTDYQGDSRVLFKDGKKFGWLQFGWGSCSGCDALQGCETKEQIIELANDLNDRVKWFDDAKECLDFFKNHDWEGDYSCHSDEQKEFIKKVIDFLESEGE